MGQYITADEVKIRSAGKVAFGTDDTDPNVVGPSFLDEIIAEAEAEVETRLSIRYAIPFRGVNDESFATLSTNTQTVIKTLVRQDAVKRLLDYDFGRGSPNEGGKYAEQLQRVYDRQMDRLVAVRDGQYNVFKYPPLVDLKLGAHNAEADDGFAGRIYVSSDGAGDYAAAQMPDPGETYWNGEILDI